MAIVPNFVNFPYFPPSPPHYFPPWQSVPPPPNNHPSPPRAPPPHGTPTPPSPAVQPPRHPISPPPPPPTPPHHHTVIIIVFVSLGGFFFLAFTAAALFCCIKNKRKRVVKETDKFKIEEHVKVKEEIVGGPHGTQTVVLTIDQDVQIEEEIAKSSATEVKPKGSHHLKSDHIISQALGINAESASTSNHHERKE